MTGAEGPLRQQWRHAGEFDDTIAPIVNPAVVPPRGSLLAAAVRLSWGRPSGPDNMYSAAPPPGLPSSSWGEAPSDMPPQVAQYGPGETA